MRSPPPSLIAALNAVLPPLVAALRLPFTLALGFVIVLVLDALILLLVSHITTRTLRVSSFGWALLAAVVISAAMLVLDVILGVNDDDTYSLRVIRRIARRQGKPVNTSAPGILFLEIDGLARPVLQRAIRDGNAPHMASWLEAGDAPPDRVGARPQLPDRRQPGRHPARLERGHPGLPLGREGNRQGDGLLLARGLRRDRAPAGERPRPAGRRRRQPRQPVLRRRGGDDPDRQPDERREARQSRLPGVPGQRVQRLAPARPVLLGGGAREDRRDPAAPARRTSARPPRRPVSAAARVDVRRRARPDRVRRAHRHDARAPRRLRDVLEL